MPIGEIAPSAKIIDLMASVRALQYQLDDCISQISFLNVEEKEELSMIRHKMISLNSNPQIENGDKK